MKRQLQPVPRITLTIEEASEACGLSINSFREHVLPLLDVMTPGQRVLVPIASLHGWVSEHATPYVTVPRRTVGGAGV